jgi:hypothetical protein
MKPIKNIRNSQEKPSLIKLSNEENDRPLLNIINKNENSMILPSTANSNGMNSITKSKFKNPISIDNASDGMRSFKDDRDEIDDFFFNTLPDISNTAVNQLTSKAKSQLQRPLTTNLTSNTSNKIDNYDRLKREKLEREIDEMTKNKFTNDMKGNTNTTTTTTTINNNKNNNNNINKKNIKDNDYHSELELDSNSYKSTNNNSTNKKKGRNGNDSKMEHYEEKEEWLLKNTDKLLRNLFDRQKKWEDTRSEIQLSIEKIKNDDMDSLENKAISEEEKQQRENKKKIELGLNKIKKLDEILEQKYKYEKELKEKNSSSSEFLSETEKQFLKKYDIEVPTTLLKEQVQKKLVSQENEENDNHDNNDDNKEEEEEEKDLTNSNKNSLDNNKETSFSSISSSKLRPILRRENGSTNLLMLDDHISFEDNNHSSSLPDQNNDNSYEAGGEGEGENEEREEEVEYFTPTKQNIIKKVADFSTENKKDKDRLKALFSNKTFLTETKSLPISLFISKPDIDDIDIDLDDDPELLQLKLEQENFKNDNISKKIFEKEKEEQEAKKESGKKIKNSKNGFKGNFIKRNIQLGGDARYYYALTDEEKLRLEAILQLPDEELESTAMIDSHHDGKEGEGEGKNGKTKEGGEGDNHSESSMKPTEIFVDPDDYIKNDSKKTLKNGFLPSVEEFDNLKKINEKLHNLVPASEWLKRRTETDLFNTSLLSNSTNINSGFWSSQVNFDNNEISQVSLFSNNSTNSNKSNAQDSVYSVREKRETKKRMKTINEKLSKLQQMRSNFESEYNIYEKQDEWEKPKFESILDTLDMKAIEEQIQLANEKLLSMKLDPSDIERNSSFNLDLNNSESILDHIDIKKMESEIELDNQKLLKMRSNSNLDLGNIELFSTEDANAITSISVSDKEKDHDVNDDVDNKLPTTQSIETLKATDNINTNNMDLVQTNSSNTIRNNSNNNDNNNSNSNSNDNNGSNNYDIEEK